MKNHPTIGDYYAHLVEGQLNAAIQKKLDETSGFKKKLAGIETVADASAKTMRQATRKSASLWNACVNTLT